MAQTETNWLHSGKYLPRFLRDFHDQKSVFKWIGERVEAARQKRRDMGEHDYLKEIDWISAHVYAIDQFLWFMAMHGYTLQPVRKPWPTRDWSASIAEMREREAAAFSEMLKARQ